MGIGIRKESGAVVGGDEINFIDTGVISVAVAAGSSSDVDVTISSATLDASITDLETYRLLYSGLEADSADIQNDTFTDSGLIITLPIAGTYRIEAVLPYTTAAAADIQFKFVVGTATISATIGESDIFRVTAPSGDATVAALPLQLATSWTTAQSILTTGALADANPAVFVGKLKATVAGTVKIQFAQVTTDATNTHVGDGAYFTAQRVVV